VNRQRDMFEARQRAKDACADLKTMCRESQMRLYGGKSKHWADHGKTKAGQKGPRPSIKWSMICSWFIVLLPCLDQMPDEAHYQISAPDRTSVWDWYMKDAAAWPGVWEPVSRSYFGVVWRKDHDDIKLRAYTRFTKCSTCIMLRAAKKEHGGTRKLHKSIKLRLAKHHMLIRRYRATALSNAQLAQMYPDKYLSIAQDATDQTDYGLPKMAEYSKSEDSFRLKQKVMVTFVHGIGVWLWTMAENLHSGPAEAVECLQRTLEAVLELRGKPLPKILFLQADNSPREIKCTYFSSYLASLIEQGVFERIYVSYHPCGHTHNECDQVASRISIAVRHTDIKCICEFHEVTICLYYFVLSFCMRLL
jgi:hypothetical protein